MILYDVRVAADSWRPCADATHAPPDGDLHLATVHRIEPGSEPGWVRVHGWVPVDDPELPRRNVLVEVRAEALPADVLPEQDR